MFSLFKKSKKAENTFVFGSSGSGKSFSGIASSLYKYDPSLFDDNFEFVLENCCNFYGYFVTEKYIEETSSLLKINKELFKVYLLILKKHNYNPIGRNIYIENNIFFMDGLEINLKKYDDEYYLNQILNDFKEDFDYMFSDELKNFSDIEKAKYILSNYSDYYDEDLFFIEDYCYNIYDENLKDNISVELFENDIYYFLDEFKIDTNESFFKDLSNMFTKGIAFHFLNNKKTKDIYKNILNLRDIYSLNFKNNEYLKSVFDMPEEYILITKKDCDKALINIINQFF